jgi:transporter family-2 protein
MEMSSALLLFVMSGLLAGIAIGIQGPLTSLIGQRLGPLESVFIVHLGGAIAAAVPLLALRGGVLGQWHTLPWYAFLSGALGLIIVTMITFTMPRLGSTATVALAVVGQLIIGVTIDHFGLLGVAVRPVDLSRVLGVLVLLVGVYLIIR